MADTAKQLGHEAAGMTEKAAGAVTGSEDLQGKGDEHLDRAEELDREWDRSRVGTTKDSRGKGVFDRTKYE